MKAMIALGFHDADSPRHRSVCDTLRAEGWEITECHTDAEGLLAKYRDLSQQYRRAGHADAVLTPFPGHFLMPLAWWLTRAPRRHLIFDAFISLFDTEVDDRRRYS